jgi:hypothetical protein
MARRGRFWALLWLGFVLVILAWVVTRQTSAVVAAAELNDLRERRSTLEDQRAGLLRRIRRAESRAVLVPRAESLGLHLPGDSEMVRIAVPEPEDH